MTDIILRTGEAGNDVALYTGVTDPPASAPALIEIYLVAQGESGVSIRVEINTTVLVKWIIDVFLTDEGAPVVVKTSASQDVRLYSDTGDIILRAGNEVSSEQIRTLVIVLRDGTIPVVPEIGAPITGGASITETADVLVADGANVGGNVGDAAIIEAPDTLIADGINLTPRIGDATITETLDILLFNGTSGADSAVVPMAGSYGSYDDFFIRAPERIRVLTLSESLMIREEEEIIIL